MSAPRPDMDHRWGARSPVHLDIRLVCQPGAITAGWLENVSISGTFVRTKLVVPLLSPVRVIVVDRLPLGRRSIELPAYVIRRDREGMGLEWSNLAPRTLQRLYSVFAPLDVEAAPWPCRIRPDVYMSMLSE
ncbi:MAG: PilZ domain-containing protein [Pseudomonadota bacterium]